MPRRVDHAQRREQITRAVWSVMATRGLDAVSLRSVAAEAGISMGRVQHYFPTKDAMILHACEAMAQVAYEHAVGAPRGDARAAPDDGTHDAAAASDGRSPRQVLRGILLVGLPHDRGQRLGAGVWFGFLTKAAVWPELAAVVRAQLHAGHELVATMLREAETAGALPHGVEPVTEAAALLAMADGLVLRVMVGALDPQVAVDAVDARLAQLFALDAAESDAR